MRIKPIPGRSDGSLSLHQSQQGPLLAGFLSVTLIGLCAAAYWQGGGSLDAVRFIDRLMIRISAVLFSLSFSASALASLFPNAATRWILGHRRDFTISFVAAFVLHLCAIARFYVLDTSRFWLVSPTILIVFRGLGTAFIAMALLDALKGSGVRRWRALHTAGEYYIWAAFFTGFAKRVSLDRFYFLFAALLILALALKVAGNNVSQLKRKSASVGAVDQHEQSLYMETGGKS
jgi:hypothetical protein